MSCSSPDLAKRIGAQGDADPDPDPEQGWTRLEPLYRLLGDHAAEWWVAEDALGGELVGYARSVARDGLFELTEFFPGELASLATYLCSDAASYVTGALIPVDGGLLRGL